jgi:4-hydroxybenzoate polyprenyltransferase
MAMHTFSAVPDIEPDRKAGIETTATFLGREKTYAYCGILWMVSGLLVSLWNLYAGFLILVYPVLATSFFLSDLSDSEAYWYYPYINAFIGMVLTMAGLYTLI